MKRPVRDALRTLAYWFPFLLLALFLHMTLWCAGLRFAPEWNVVKPTKPAEYVAVTLPPLRAKEVPRSAEDLPRPPEDRPVMRDLNGQLVEVAKPPEERRPEEAQYLAQYDTTVERETRAPTFEINPEVVAPEHSEEMREAEQQSAVEDLGAIDPSTGAQARKERFDPKRDGVLGTLSFPSTPVDSSWERTNREGNEDPIPASVREAFLSGAPQNDLLREALGTGTYLNTKELLYAEYLLRIRRLVNFYWAQNIDNLPASVRIAKPEYTTQVRAVLDGNGGLEIVEVTDPSGLTVLDDCVIRAFKVAGPFPNPPDELISDDGRVYLPDSSWTVIFSSATNRPVGVDPNAGVQFPGLLTNPR